MYMRIYSTFSPAAVTKRLSHYLIHGSLINGIASQLNLHRTGNVYLFVYVYSLWRKYMNYFIIMWVFKFIEYLLLIFFFHVTFTARLHMMFQVIWKMLKIYKCIYFFRYFNYLLYNCWRSIRHRPWQFLITSMSSV